MAGCYAVFHKQLGDLVLLQPALARLQARHGGVVHLLTRSGHEPLVSLLPGVKLQRGPAVMPRSRLYGFDGTRKSALRSLMAPAWSRMAVFPQRDEREWYHPLIFRPTLQPALGEEYVAEYYWRHLPWPSVGAFMPPKLELPPAEWQPQSFRQEPFLLLNPTSGWQKKSWTPDGWAEVIRAVRRQTGWRVVMTSASEPWQLKHCREIKERAGSEVESLASGTSLREFLWLCSRARGVLGVDGSASHLAAAFGIKNLTLFGPTNMRNWHRPGEISRALQSPASEDGIARLRNLKAEPVLAEANWLAAG